MSFVVGLTGGIGSGKTTVANLFAELGVILVDADLIAREIVQPGQTALVEIADHFGAEILQPNGELDRAALRQKVFTDPKQRLWLEQLTHPLIRQRTLERLAAAKSDYVLLVSPLLLETDQHQLCQHILVVDLTEEQQLERTMQRDSNDENQVRAILKAQASRQQRLDKADDIIDNSGQPDALVSQVKQLDHKLRQLAAKQAR